MIKSVGALGIAALVAAPVVGFAVPASAHSAGSASATVASAHAAVPNSNIVGTGAKTKYNPKSLNSTWSGPTEETCTVALESFTIANTTTKTQKITYSGALFYKLPAGQTVGICTWGSGNFTFTFGLKVKGVTDNHTLAANMS